MYVTYIEEADKRKAIVYVDGGESFPLYKGEIKRYGIREQNELSDDEYGHIIRDILIKRAKERAMHILKGADKTERQIREKLERGRYPSLVIDEVIKFLLKYEYINDYDYSVSYIKTYSKSQSERLMREKLLQRGVDRDIIVTAMEDAMKEADYDCQSIITDILRRKKYNNDTADIKEKNRMVSHLLRKGFMYEDILASMREM
ncbi:MAG: RecX family transcriptional regulator [Lachnospiraceae bacterium]